MTFKTPCVTEGIWLMLSRHESDALDRYLTTDPRDNEGALMRHTCNCEQNCACLNQVDTAGQDCDECYRCHSPQIEEGRVYEVTLTYTYTLTTPDIRRTINLHEFPTFPDLDSDDEAVFQDSKIEWEESA